MNKQIKPIEYIVEVSGVIYDTHRDDRTGETNQIGLVTLINRRIKEGWIPMGGISSGTDGGGTYVLQSLVKYNH